MKKYLHYQKLVGMTKESVVSEIGTELNYYPSDKWFYELKTNWMGRITYLIIYFENDIVEDVRVKKSFGKPHL